MSARACAHCGSPVESAVGDRDKEGALYCCTGCETAAAIIRSAGLDRYYAEREALPDRPGAPVRGWEHVPVESLPDGGARARLAIDGLHCASCVWVSEKVMCGTPGVREATVSYATGRAEVVWDPAQTSLDQIASRVSAIGYRPRPLTEASRPDRDLVLRLGVAAFAAGNAMMFSVPLYLGWWEGIADRYAALFRWSLLALATPAALWSAVPFYKGALAGLRARVPHVDLPVSIGVIALYAHGVWATLHGEESYLDSLTMLVALLLAGRVADQGRRRRAVDAAVSLAASAPRVARRVGASGPEEVSPEALAVGDVLEVGSGEEIAADGIVLSGRGEVRMALLTGESEPRPVQPGDAVVAGAVLVEGALRLSVEATAAQSLLARMAEELKRSADRPAEPTAADRVAPAFTVLTLLVAVLTWTAHASLGGFSPDALASAWKATIAVLVVACPCALALSTPLSTAAGLGAAARRGLLMRSGDALRRLSEVDLVVLDKTGTLTGGTPEVVSASDEVLRVAAGLERNSLHPVARAIVAEARARGLAIPLGEPAREEPGRGVTGTLDGRSWTVRSGGPGRIWVCENKLDNFAPTQPWGEILLRDRPRPDAARAVQALRAAGLELVMLTGDHAEVAGRISDEIGLSAPVAGADPEAKAAWIRARQAEGRRVLFVGDGLNDGPALAAAHTGLAMGSGAAASLLVADGVVSAPSVGPVLAGLAAARVTTDSVRQSLRVSLAYNAVAVLFAALGFINPLVAAVLMPLSSAVVVGRASRVEPRTAALLERADPRQAPGSYPALVEA